MSRRALTSLVFLLLLLLNAACGPTSPEQPSAGQPAAPTQVVVRILNLDLALTAQPSMPVVPSATLAPTATPFPTFTPRPPAAQVESQSSPTPSCSTLGEFIKHLSINDYTAMPGLTPFTKVWQVKNAGTCVWTTAYALVFAAGEQLSGPAVQPLLQEVQPGETIDLRLSLVAPEKPGAHVSSWMLQDADGNRFGIGSDGSQPLSVTIMVKTPPPPTPS